MKTHCWPEAPELKPVPQAEPEGSNEPTLTVVRLRLSTRTGRFPARSDYVELLWTPVLGPTATLMWRRFVMELDARGAGAHDLVVEHVGSELGVSAHVARRSFERLLKFGVAKFDGLGIEVLPGTDGLPLARLQRLSPRLQALHRVLIERAG